MKKKSKQQKYLEQYVGLKVEVDILQEELEWMQKEEGISSSSWNSDGSIWAKTTTGDKLGVKVIRKEEEIRRLEEKISAKKDLMLEIVQAIERVPNPMQRSVLRRRYINCEKGRLTVWNDVALSIYKNDDANDVQSAHRLHGRALQSIAPIIDRIEKEKSHP